MALVTVARSKFATKERWRWPLLLFAVSSIIAIQSYAFWKTAITRPLAFAAARITADGVVLQSSNASCLAASAANIARILGKQRTEREMARLCKTSADGTYPTQALVGLRQIGIQGRKVSNSERDIRSIKPPAILFFLDDTHAVVYVGFSNELAEFGTQASAKHGFPHRESTTSGPAMRLNFGVNESEYANGSVDGVSITT